MKKTMVSLVAILTINVSSVLKGAKIHNQTGKTLSVIISKGTCVKPDELKSLGGILGKGLKTPDEIFSQMGGEKCKPGQIKDFPSNGKTMNVSKGKFAYFKTKGMIPTSALCYISDPKGTFHIKKGTLGLTCQQIH